MKKRRKKGNFLEKKIKCFFFSKAHLIVNIWDIPGQIVNEEGMLQPGASRCEH